jgi:thioredoxin reductase
MTVDPNLYITLSVSGLAGLAMVTAAGLSGWRGWLALKRQELAQRQATASQAEPAMPSAASRIEVADLKERIRKLEAIAAGVDL